MLQTSSREACPCVRVLRLLKAGGMMTLASPHRNHTASRQGIHLHMHNSCGYAHALLVCSLNHPRGIAAPFGPSQARPAPGWCPHGCLSGRRCTQRTWISTTGGCSRAFPRQGPRKGLVRGCLHSLGHCHSGGMAAEAAGLAFPHGHPARIGLHSACIRRTHASSQV